MWTSKTHPITECLLEALKFCLHFKQTTLHYSLLLSVLWVLICLSVNAVYFHNSPITCEWLQKFPHSTHRLQFRLNRMASILLTFNKAGIYLPYSVVPAFNFFSTCSEQQSQGSIVNVWVGYKLDNLGFHFQQGQEFSLLWKHPELLLGIPRFLFNGYGRVISEDKQFDEM